MDTEQVGDFRCETCPMRAKHDARPRSLIGRFWRWHIGFCPGWAKYFASRTAEQKDALREQYNLK